MGFDFSLSDDNVLLLSTCSVGAMGITGMIAPASTQDILIEPTFPRTVASDSATRWLGQAQTFIGATGVVVSRSDDKKCKKDMLKLHGAGWAAVAAMMAYNAYGPDKVARKDTANVVIPVYAVMAGLCAWRGFKEEEEEV